MTANFIKLLLVLLGFMPAVIAMSNELAFTSPVFWWVNCGCSLVAGFAVAVELLREPLKYFFVGGVVAPDSA